MNSPFLPLYSTFLFHLLLSLLLFVGLSFFLFLSFSLTCLFLVVSVHSFSQFSICLSFFCTFFVVCLYSL
ncbi:hypothetical protein CSUI_007483 [Cystoisospora suis]|uniref:Transmembrane protein n=1 Tax=Cystoisospora suis TaxID=483139 RepID=A0A2C6KPZ7_9APIC|nr:hypothetical protein CSUI_007483 [Cystoisospora suis]